MNELVSIPEYNLRVRFIHPGAKLPTRASEYSAGLDLYTPLHVYLPPGEYFKVPLGIEIALPPGFEGQIRPRSGLAAKHGVTVLNSPGTIDSDYRGEVAVLLINHGKEVVQLYAGDRVAQLVIAHVPFLAVKQVDVLDSTERGTGGFGSSGT